ncbi:MAG: DUF262 domain-containing protein [Alistipes sp.]|nr:DUF262 domain-containing protein [Alistipes sp.]
MKIELTKITVRELTKGYRDSNEEGIVGYSGLLNIRPKYQREFVYNDKQRDAVITTINNGFPLNVMYWAVCDDGTFEIIDGQQRTVSVCQYVAGDFAYNFRYFHNLQQDEQEKILDYELMIYLCSGTDKEKLDWFKTINIAGAKLTDQELRNAVYSGSWVSDAKRYFSKSGCAAYKVGGDYMTGSAIRQEYLETAISWISEGNIDIYMAKHQNDANAAELWLYFQAVINWVKMVFPKYRKEMKGVDWGALYNRYGKQPFDSLAIEEVVAKLMQDEDVTNKKGIYSYIFDHNQRHLNIRAFSERMKRVAYERQLGVCPLCNEYFLFEQMEGDHITPWSEGGMTIAENCQMLCRDCNRHKSNK